MGQRRSTTDRSCERNRSLLSRGPSFCTHCQVSNLQSRRSSLSLRPRTASIIKSHPGGRYCTTTTCTYPALLRTLRPPVGTRFKVFPAARDLDPRRCTARPNPERLAIPLPDTDSKTSRAPLITSPYDKDRLSSSHPRRLLVRFRETRHLQFCPS